MRISNSLFDTLKWIALNFVPALEVLVLTLGKIWGLPYYAEIGATIAAIGVFLAAILKVSTVTYLKDKESGIVFEDEDTEIDDSIEE